MPLICLVLQITVFEENSPILTRILLPSQVMNNEAGPNNNNRAGDENFARGEDRLEGAEDGGGEREGGGANMDNNWNPIEWDRAAEELTWERLLGKFPENGALSSYI